MRKLLKEEELNSELEKERYHEFLKKHSLEKAYIYYVTDFSLGAGYDIIVSKEKVKITAGLLNFEEPFEMITDIDAEVENF